VHKTSHTTPSLSMMSTALSVAGAPSFIANHMVSNNNNNNGSGGGSSGGLLMPTSSVTPLGSGGGGSGGGMVLSSGGLGGGGMMNSGSGGGGMTGNSGMVSSLMNAGILGSAVANQTISMSTGGGGGGSSNSVVPFLPSTHVASLNAFSLDILSKLSTRPYHDHQSEMLACRLVLQCQRSSGVRLLLQGVCVCVENLQI
jgi:hypothetical protein